MTIPGSNNFKSLDELHNAAVTDNTTLTDTSNSSSYSDASIIEVITEVAKQSNCTIEQAYKGTAVVLNQGGTSP